MDIILLILAKSLDKHGTALVHITYPSLISVLIFAMFLEIFTHVVVGENVFLQFIAVKIPWQIYYRNNMDQCANICDVFGDIHTCSR